ncbi:MAG TPA: GNAT family N-acetyltransferase [Chloroflexota bacterium]|nr:GNAT family N-acetyltransferase [Chloroflexota bacterium]
MRIPPLETDRLVIRPFVMDDLDTIHRILDVELAEAETGAEGAKTRDERTAWLRWTTLAYEELARLNQPPYGERAIALRGTGEVIGACGYVPCLDAFGQISALRPEPDVTPDPGRTSTEFGRYWAVAPGYQRRGYAAEASRALIAFAFAQLSLARIVATTAHDNEPSIGVMRSVGMRIAYNPSPTPPWLQVVGVLRHSDIEAPGVG